MSLPREARLYRSFIVSVSLAIALVLSAVFLGMSIRTRALIHDETLAHARAHVGSVIRTRDWNARYGGVWVEKKEGVEANPFLHEPDIQATDGRTLVLRNPSAMTREISEYTRRLDDFSFHLTSLKPINPGNAPDAFERQALRSFESGAKEATTHEKVEGRAFLRYMVPLHTTRDCLGCHAAQGYRLGDVRGGISVSIDVARTEQRIAQNTVAIAVFGVSTIVLLLAALWFFVRKLMARVAEATQRIEEMAITDALTGLFNRRHAIGRLEEEFGRARRSGHPLSCMMIDVDHFKSINDRFGHLVGDEVLRETAARLAAGVRKHDILGRYGGEEFLVILPETEFSQALALAERLRASLQARPIKDVEATASFGVACGEPGDETIDDLLKRADAALYLAKEGGRNRVHPSAA